MPWPLTFGETAILLSLFSVAAGAVGFVAGAALTYLATRRSGS